MVKRELRRLLQLAFLIYIKGCVSNLKPRIDQYLLSELESSEKTKKVSTVKELLKRNRVNWRSTGTMNSIKSAFRTRDREKQRVLEFSGCATHDI